MCNELDSFRPIVIITGFGPFDKYPVNASWEAVKLINKYEIEKIHNIKLVLLEIPVAYEHVDALIPGLWETHAPKLVIHVGVSGLAKCLTLESQAHKIGYKRLDYLDKSPPNFTCPAEGYMKIQTKLNVDRICEEFNNLFAGESISAIKSNDAGRYLCEYIYYTSLTMNSTRTLFVHVPDTGIYPSDMTARGLEKIIDFCINQIDEDMAEKLKKTKLNIHTAT